MSDCCSVSNQSQTNHFPPKYQCPVNRKEYKEVSKTTILHHIKSPWSWAEKEQGYYFCDDPNCDVVYFGEDDSVIPVSELRTSVGVKSSNIDAIICYCFGINKKTCVQNPELKGYILAKTKAKECACEIQNPSGKCCLKDF